MISIRSLLLAALALSLQAGDLRGVVKGPEGGTVAGAVVAATPEAPNILSDGRHAARVARADAQGRFRLTGLPEGAYGATATAPGVGSAFLGHLAVPATGAAKELVFRLEAGMTVEGAITIPGGQALEGLQVLALRESEDVGDIFCAAVEGGRYRLGLASGSYTILASAPGFESGHPTLWVPGGPDHVDLRLFSEKGSDPALAEELAAMAHADQDIRNRAIQHPEDQELRKTWIQGDKAREARLQEIVKLHGWPSPALVGARGAAAAWLMTQHASAPFLKACLPAMKQAAESGELGWDEVALSIDRDLVHDGKEQLYGSQFHTDGKGVMQPDPIEDEAHLDERRKAMGLEPFAHYAVKLRRMYTPSH